MSLLRLPNKDDVRIVAAVFIATIVFLALSIKDDLPTRVVVPWAKGECFWLNGTIVDKEKVDDGMTTGYHFYVVGTLDNTTEFNSIVHGTSLEYNLMPVGLQYEGRVCDTLTLREAVANGTVDIIDWIIGD